MDMTHTEGVCEECGFAVYTEVQTYIVVEGEVWHYACYLKTQENADEDRNKGE